MCLIIKHPMSPVNFDPQIPRDPREQPVLSQEQRAAGVTEESLRAAIEDTASQREEYRRIKAQQELRELTRVWSHARVHRWLANIVAEDGLQPLCDRR